MRRTLCRPERLLQQGKGRRILVVSADVLEQTQKLVQRGFVNGALQLPDAVAGALPEVLAGASGAGDANHREIEPLVPHYVVESRKSLLVCQITHRSEQ